MNINEKGQGLIEFLVCAQAVGFLLLGLMMAFYMLYSKAIASYQLQKTVLCLEKFKAKEYKCKKATEDFFKKNLWLHKNQKVSISKKSQKTTATLTAKFLDKTYLQSQTISVQK